MSISVCISTFGADVWRTLAETRALPSAQEADEVIVQHEPKGTIGTSRNDAASRASGDYLCFLDADDELGPGFMGAMRRALERERRGPTSSSGDGPPLLFTPAVSYVTGRRASPARIWPECEMQRGNWLVISTLIPRDLFLSMGGFRDYGDPPGSTGYEDWGLMSLLVQAGAEIVKVPEAVLLAHWGARSRNRSASPRERNQWHFEIGRDVWPEHYPPDWLTREAGPRRRVRERRVRERRA